MGPTNCSLQTRRGANRGRRVAAHARSAESVKRCVRHGVDVIYHATYADEEARDLLEAHKDTVFVAPAMFEQLARRSGRPQDAPAVCRRGFR